MTPIAEKILDLLTPQAGNWALPAAMSGAKPGVNDRALPRHPVPPTRQSCQLRIEASVVPALLENESDSGFAVMVDRLYGLEVGKRIELRTDEGWLPLQIVYVQEVAKPLDADARRDFRFRLGLKR